MKSNETHVDSKSVDDIQAALFLTFLGAQFCHGEKRPVENEIDTSGGQTQAMLITEQK